MPADSAPLSHARRAVFVAFMVNGTATGIWAGHIPVVRDRLELGEALLGVALLQIALGAMAAMPFAGGLAVRLGSGRVTTAAGVAFALTIVLPLLAPSYASLIIAALLFGVATGTMDVAMNAQAAAVQAALQRPIMSSCHAGYSMGVFVGAGLAGGLLWLGTPPAIGVGVCSLALAGVMLWSGVRLLADASDAGSSRVVLPRGSAWLIGGLALLGYLAEGAILDWSAILLADSLRVTASTATMGFAAFSATMTLGRLSGDAVIRYLGERPTLIVSGLITAAGLALAVGAPSLVPAILGFSVAGLGLANIVPILFTAGSRAPGVAPAVGVAMVASLGYLGVLAGPALIGFVAEAAGLRTAMACLVSIGLVVAAAGWSGLLREQMGAGASPARPSSS